MRTPRIILATLATLAWSMFGGPAANASIAYSPVTSFNAGPGSRPLGVAIDQANGDVYVTNLFSEERIDKFDSSGELVAPVDPGPLGRPLSPFGQGKTIGPGGPEFFSGAAVNPVNEHLYAVDGLSFGGPPQLQTYDGETGDLLSQFPIAGSVNLLELVAAVQIASDSVGNVYLPNSPNNEVQRFTPEGSLLQTITGAGGDALKEPTGVAVDSAGNVYVADNGNGRVEEFDSSGAFVMAVGTGVDQTTKGNVCTAASKDTCGPGSDGSQAVAVDATGDIFVGENSGSGFHVVLYSPAGEQLSDFGMGTIGASELGAINALAVSASGVVYVTDGGNGVVWVYAQQRRPSILSESGLSVGSASETLEARVDPGYADTSYRFEYGTSTAYGASVPAPDAGIGAGLKGPVAVAQELAGLRPGTTYHYRLLATNAVGQVEGADQTFTTPPARLPMVSTGQAGGVAQNTATLTGSVNPEGFETGYEFDFGVDTSYGTRIFGDAGFEPGAHTFTAPLQGLTPGATYHYRILATNVFGTVYGADQVFTTASYPTSTLAATEAPPLLSTPLLAPAGSAPAGSATAVGARPAAAHVARHRKAGRARRGSRGFRGHRRKGGGSGGADRIRNADRGGK